MASKTTPAIFIFFAIALSFSPVSSTSKVHARRFWISDDMFWKDGNPFQIIGGDLHYFRVLPQYWEDRLWRAKALGLNTIQTYVPWNLHEPLPGEWAFDGIADLESFLKISQDLGFLVMLRVGPYICAEWDLGGFPAWLLATKPTPKLRSSDPVFLQFVKRWWDVLLPRIAPFLYEKGGPVIMVQIENEFGSYGDDQAYLHHLVALARKNLGAEAILYTTDGGTVDTLRRGSIRGKDVFSAVDFSTGEDAWSIFKMQKKFNAQGKSPPLTAEFYTGWLTHWMEDNAKTDANFTATELDKILSRNGSAVLYMAHGGTNFGFYSGANTGQNESDYKADLTSYDYDAPIKEYGDVDNAKFKALRTVIEKYHRTPLPPFPSNIQRAKYGNVKVHRFAFLFEVLDFLCDPLLEVRNEKPVTMESVGQMFGFLLYVCNISEYTTKENNGTLFIPKVHDRAQIFISCSRFEKYENMIYLGVIDRWSNKELAVPNLQCSSVSLIILVENMGRVNYGLYMHDVKGILSNVFLNGVVLNRWRMIPISFNNLNKLLQANPIMQVAADSSSDTMRSLNTLKDHPGVKTSFPGFFEGRFSINSTDQVHDTFVSLRGWNKGVVFVNDFNLGRFWTSVGPQCTLYLPAPVLKHGENVIVILELHAHSPALEVDLVDQPDFSCRPNHNLI